MTITWAFNYFILMMMVCAPQFSETVFIGSLNRADSSVTERPNAAKHIYRLKAFHCTSTRALNGVLVPVKSALQSFRIHIHAIKTFLSVYNLFGHFTLKSLSSWIRRFCWLQQSKPKPQVSSYVWNVCIKSKSTFSKNCFISLFYFFCCLCVIGWGG